MSIASSTTIASGIVIVGLLVNQVWSAPNGVPTAETSQEVRRMYRRPLSLGGPSRAVYATHPQVPIQSNDLQVHPSIGRLLDRIVRHDHTPDRKASRPSIQPTTLPTSSVSHTLKAKTDKNKDKAILKILKERKGIRIAAQRPKRRRRESMTSLGTALVASGSTLDAPVGNPASGSVSRALVLDHARPASSLPAIHLRRTRQSASGLQTPKERIYNPAQARIDKERFKKEWQQKGLNARMPPSELAIAVWDMKTYSEKPFSMGRLAADLIRDEGGENYMAQYKATLQNLMEKHHQFSRSMGQDPAFAALDKEEKTEILRKKARDYVSKAPKRINKRGPRPYEIRRKHANAMLVGTKVRADLQRENLSLDEMTIEQIEEKTRNLEVPPMTQPMAVNALYDYLAMTRGMDTTDFNIYRRKRKLFHQDVANTAVPKRPRRRL